MNGQEIKENTGFIKKIKRAAAHFCIRLHAPIIRQFKQKTDAADREIERLNTGLEKIQQQMQDYERLQENVRNLNSQMEGYQYLAENVRNLNQQLESYGKLAENVRNTNQQLQGYESLVENVRNLNQQLKGFTVLPENIAGIKQDLESIAVNIRHNNTTLEQIESTLDMYGIKIAALQKRSKDAECSDCKKDNGYGKDLAEKDMAAGENSSKSSSVSNMPNKDNHPSKMSYTGIDYFDFENHFRGSRAQIKKNQQIYLKYFQGRHHVLDLGCGRGEFLELLQDHGVQAYGVDLYEEFVALCQQKQLHAVQGDAIAFLEQAEEADGIFAGQLIEHLTLEQLIRLTEAAYEKLKAGSFLILETPNPTSLAIFTNSFYIDPSHEKPVHPLTMRYLLEKAGFEDITVLFTESSRLPVQIPELDLLQAQGIAEFNQAMKEVERTLFGSQDYAVIAKK